MKLASLLAAGVAALVLAGPAHAEYPERPIHVIVPFPPGGSTDVVTRIVVAKAQELLGQNIIVENRGGAGSIIGSDYVAKAAPDGYTVLVGQTAFAVNASLREKLPYDTLKDFTAISLMADHPGVLLAQHQKPYDSFKEFVDYVKAHPGKVVYSSAGTGSWPHLSMAMLAENAGLDMMHVPYQGTGPAKADLIAGRVDVKIEAYATSMDMVKDGRLKVLAVTSTERDPALPDAPTVAELGYPGFETSYWIGLLGPAGMPAEARDKLEQAFVQAVADPDVASKLKAQHIHPRGLPAADLQALLRNEIDKWAEVIRKGDIEKQ